MTRIRQVKTNFTAGEVSPELLGRGDLRAYQNGAQDWAGLLQEASSELASYCKRVKIGKG